MMHAGLELARRLEAAEGLNEVGCAEAHQQFNPALGSAVLEAGGGYAIFVGADSPLTHAVTLGMRGPVSSEELDCIEEFYRARGAAAAVELCPLADASLVEQLSARGYGLIEFNNVLVRPLAGTAIDPVESVRAAYTDEEYLWARTVACGFLEKDELTQDELDVGRAIWHVPGARCYLAFSAGRATGAGAMAIHQGLAMFFADSTLLGFRGAGLQQALIRARLRIALEEGCDLATASTMPGSSSQRNYERHGFSVAYTKAVLAR